MALLTIATDDADEAMRLIAALFGPADGAAEAPKAPTRSRSNSAPAAPAPVAAAAPAPAPAAPPMAAPAPAPAAPAAPPMAAPAPAPAAPAAPAPAPIAPAAAPAPAPAAAPAADYSRAAPGWTLEHMQNQAVAFVQSPKGGPERLSPLLQKYGLRTVKETPPGLWHVLYQEMTAILEAA